MKPTSPYLTEGPRNGWTISAAAMIEALFPGMNYGTHVPQGKFTPWTYVQGVRCMYMSSAGAQAFWASQGRKRSGMHLRALAECPDCGRKVAASRINQHARVHYPR
jgi:hypothetical protein